MKANKKYLKPLLNDLCHKSGMIYSMESLLKTLRGSLIVCLFNLHAKKTGLIISVFYKYCVYIAGRMKYLEVG